jgi:methanogenic corrinoid protein MtbC1
MWEQDLCTFVDVTVAVGRLQQALRDMSAGLAFRPADGESVRRVLLVPAPGEQHTFGLVMVSEFFREAGWEVTGGPHPQLDPVAQVRKEWVDVVGFTLAGELHLASLTAAIAAVRKASLNPRVGILVGGPQFLLNPGLAREVGADALAIDGSLAPSIADKLVETRAETC